LKGPAALLVFLTPTFATAASAQEFNRPEKIVPERYVYGLPIVKIKEGSRLAALRLRPQGWDLFIVAVNKRRIPLVTDFDGPDPATQRKAADSTALHEDLAGKGPLQLTLVTKKGGNTRGALIYIEFPEWDAGAVYHVKKWHHDLKKWVLPNATTEVGTEQFRYRHFYSELERRAEVADFERLARDKEEKRKNKDLALKSLESFKAGQRKLRMDEGSPASGEEEQLYRDARGEVANRMSRAAGECRIQKDWFECFRASILATGMRGSMNSSGRGNPLIESMRKELTGLDVQTRGRLRAQAAAEGSAAFKDKRYVDAALAATLSQVLGDPEAASAFMSARRAGFSAAEMSKSDLDGWLSMLGGLNTMPAAGDLKENEVYRVDGKVEKGGPFTLVKSGRDGSQAWVFEDKQGLKFEAGDTFIAVGVYEGKKPPAAQPEELQGLPLIRLVVVR
jgi:hypothetical protein